MLQSDGCIRKSWRAGWNGMTRIKDAVWRSTTRAWWSINLQSTTAASKKVIAISRAFLNSSRKCAHRPLQNRRWNWSKAPRISAFARVTEIAGGAERSRQFSSPTILERTMTAKAFVKALRGPEDTPDTINPLSYLLTAIHTLDDQIGRA